MRYTIFCLFVFSLLEAKTQIINQPNNARICNGLDTSYTVSVFYSSPSFLWQTKVGMQWVNLNNNWRFSGTQSSTINLKKVSDTINNSSYRCLIYSGSKLVDSSNSVSLIVLLSSVVPNSIISSSNTIKCPLGKSTLKVNGGSLGSGADWLWYVDSCNGKFIGNGDSITINPYLSTTYYTKAKGSCNTTSCVQINISVLNTNSVSPKAVYSSNYPISCPGDTTTLSIDSGFLGSGANWYWYKDSCGVKNVGKGKNLIIYPDSTTNYFVRAEGTCNITNCVSFKILVSNRNSFSPNSIKADINPTCKGQYTTLTVLGGKLGTGGNWKWYSNSCGSGLLGTGNSIKVNPSVTTVYFVRAEGNCNITNCVTQTINVTNTFSTDPTEIIVSKNPICQGNKLTLSAVGGSLGTNAKWKWYKSSCGSNPIDSGTVISITTSTSSDYFLKGEGVCNSTNCLKTYVIVNPLPKASLSTNSSSVCLNGTSPIITFTGTGGTPPYTFTFRINTGSDLALTTTGTNNTATLNVPTNSVGSFVYSLVSIKDASSTACSQNQSGAVTIKVNPLPNATISGATTVCQLAAQPVVTLTGSGGTAPYTFTYKLNGSVKSRTSKSSNSDTIMVPTSKAGTFNYVLMSVKDANSPTCSQNLSDSVAVIVNPLPNASLSANSSSVCLNGTSPIITFTGTGGTPPYTFTFRINTGSDLALTTTGTNNTATLNVPTNSVGSFVYSLVSIKDASSAACSQNQSGAVTIKVNPLPNANISGATTVCQLAAQPVVTLTGSGGTAPYTFTYKLNGSVKSRTSKSSNSDTIMVPTSKAGTFNYVLISVKDANSPTCSQNLSDSVAVIVNPLPNASLSANSSSVCLNGTSPIITFTGTGGTPPYTFTFRINTGSDLALTTTGTNNTATLNVPTNSVGSFVYSLVSIKDASSAACSQNQSGAVTIKVNPLPNANISGATTVCQLAAQPVVTLTGSGGTAPYTFTYKLNGSVKSRTSKSSNSDTIMVPTSKAGTFNYVLMSVKDANSPTCSQNLSDSVAVIVNPLPNASLSANSSSVCLNGTSPIITFTGTGGTPPYTFTFRINTGSDLALTTTGTNNTATLNVPTNSVGSFVYSLVSIKDASSTACSQNQSGAVTIKVNPLPNATISGATTVCQLAAQPVVTLTGSGGTAPYTFTYKLNGSVKSRTSKSSNSDTIMVPTSKAGTFNYVLMSVKDANSPTCSQNLSDSVAVIVNPLPNASLSANSSSVCLNGTSPIITFTGTGGTPPYTFTFRINTGSDLALTTTGTNNTATLNVPTNSVGSFVYSLVSIKDASSAACSQNQSGAVTIKVNPLPNANISGATTVCQLAAQPVVTLTGSGGTAPYTFTYKLNGSVKSRTSKSSNSDTIMVPTSKAGTFNYVLISVKDANSPTCSQNLSDSVAVIVNSNPLPLIITKDTILCKNQYWTQYCTKSSNNRFLWEISKDSGEIQTGQGTNCVLVHWKENANKNKIKVIEQSKVHPFCSESATKSISFINDTSLNPSKVIVKNNNINSKILICEACYFKYYEWGFDIDKNPSKEVILYSGNTVWYKFEQLDMINYSYWVKVGDSKNGCLTKCYFKEPIFLNLNESLAFENKLLMFPNPNLGKLNTKSTLPINNISICDQLGKVIIETKPPLAFEDEFTLDISMLSKGIYTVKYYTNQGVILRKLIRE